MSHCKCDLIFWFTLCALLFGCSGEKSTPETSDVSHTQDSSRPEIQEDINVTEDNAAAQDTQSDIQEESDPCVIGYPPSIQLGKLEGVESFIPFQEGDALPFEYGPQGGAMIVADLLHLGTAGLDGTITIQVFNADTGESLLTFEQAFMGITLDEAGLENPTWMCSPNLGNIIPDLWISTWDDLPNDQRALMKAFVSFESEASTPSLVLSFEVEGVLTYNL